MVLNNRNQSQMFQSSVGNYPPHQPLLQNSINNMLPSNQLVHRLPNTHPLPTVNSQMLIPPNGMNPQMHFNTNQTARSYPQFMNQTPQYNIPSSGPSYQQDRENMYMVTQQQQHMSNLHPPFQQPTQQPLPNPAYPQIQPTQHQEFSVNSQVPRTASTSNSNKTPTKMPSTPEEKKEDTTSGKKINFHVPDFAKPPPVPKAQAQKRMNVPALQYQTQKAEKVQPGSLVRFLTVSISDLPTIASKLDTSGWLFEIFGQVHTSPTKIKGNGWRFQITECNNTIEDPDQPKSGVMKQVTCIFYDMDGIGMEIEPAPTVYVCVGLFNKQKYMMQCLKMSKADDNYMQLAKMSAQLSRKELSKLMGDKREK